MAKNTNYKRENEDFILDVSKREGVMPLAGGVFYEILETGEGMRPVNVNSIATVYYKGTLINGKVFDDNTGQGYPDAFRIGELIAGWQIALLRMRVGDKWRIYVPAKHGYGAQSVPGIPRHSTLIFEIMLAGCA